MSFGLCNAPSTLQPLIDQGCAEEINYFIIVYLDNILIDSHGVGEGWGHLQCALAKLRGPKLFGRLGKCELVKYKVD